MMLLIMMYASYYSFTTLLTQQYAVSLMEGSFFVNAASLFMLSALIERRGIVKKKKANEKTSVTMPRGLIEGTEVDF
jgi:hypothetical protein